MKFWYICFALSCCVGLGFSQNQSIEIKGKVVEATSQQPIEFATIMIGSNESKKTITGAISDLDGHFNLSTEVKEFYVEISFIGYNTKTINEFKIIDGLVDLGTIALTSNSQMLAEVEVRAEKSQTEFKLDKRVFNVGKDLSTTGASALEVLNNVPSVNVSIEGAISLRGSQGVQILINGKPSVIANEQGKALGTITADMIEKIEVITNPSAKYDAEGTSGIINIILKKEDRKGINGSATLNVGIPQNFSVGLSLNRRTEKFNLFSQLGVGYRSFPRYQESINRDLVNGTAILSEGTEYRNEVPYNFILGTDYHIDRYNVVTLSGSFAYEVEDQPSDINFAFQDASGTVISKWKRKEITTATNPKYQYELQYKHDFKDHEDHTLLFSALGNLFAKDQSSEFANLPVLGNITADRQQTRTDFKEANYTFKLDYNKPFSKKWTLETGAQYVWNDVGNDYAVTNLINEEWLEDPNLTNLFKYNQKVLGAYSTGAYEADKWGLKLGLRLENTDLQTRLATTGEQNNHNYSNLFPSLHTSYKLTEHFSVQAGYSRRIYRPRLWSLNPFFNIRNNYNIRTGNPNLLPEFTDSYELNSIYIFGELSMNLGVYHRYTTDVVESIATFEDNISISKPYNIGTNQATGVEVNAKYSPNKSWSVNGDFNLNYFDRKGVFEATTIDFKGNRWTTKLTNKFKLPAQIEFEITGNLESKYKTVQSELSGILFADLGLRKKIMNGRGVFNLSIRDLFASRFRESETNQTRFYLYSYSLQGRFITAGFSYGFGKGEAMEFSGSRHH